VTQDEMKVLATIAFHRYARQFHLLARLTTRDDYIEAKDAYIHAYLCGAAWAYEKSAERTQELFHEAALLLTSAPPDSLGG
jgi:hypothetical protein